MARKSQSYQTPTDQKVDGAPPQSNNDAEIIKIVGECRREAEEARRSRIATNKRNWEMYYGHQDWSDKQEGQSTEFLPKVAGAVEQFSAFTKRALTQFGDWFSVDVPVDAPISSDAVRNLLKHYMTDIYVSPTKSQNFPTILTNAVKTGLLESLLILKVHGHKVEQQTYSAQGKKIVKGTREVWRPRIDLIPSEDYYPDPTTRGLYEIHRVERDLIDVQDAAERGVYDKAMVDLIREDCERTDKDRARAAHRNQNEASPPSFRKRVVIDEFYGTLIDRDGKVLYRNGICAVANEKYVIRRPQDNPAWHGRSALLATPLIQVPFTVWGRALFDQAASLNQALNELYNLMLDGGIGEVWGVRQVHADWLADPRQISGGIPQAATLVVNEGTPVGGKVVETVSNGTVPQEAMAMFQLTDREFQQASLVNDVRLGNLPPRQVKATEVVEASNNSSVMVDAFASDLENECIEKALEMLFLNILQNADDLAADEVVAAIGTDAAFKLANMTAAERFAAFAGKFKFKVNGLSGTLSKARDFQKMMAMMQAIGTNPVLMQAFMSKFSPEKALTYIFKSLNVDPETLFNSVDEQKQVDQRMQQVAQMAQLTGGGTQQASPQPGMATTQSEIAQNANPSGGPA